MGRRYIEHDMAHFTRKDITHVDMQLFDGSFYENLEPRRLFPLSGLDKYITLLDEKGIEQAIIRDVRTLPKDERIIIEDCLTEYYLIPKIQRIYSRQEKFGLITFDVETDRGPASVEIRGVVHGIKLIYGSRILIRDTNDNRYEIPDVNALDKHSRQLIDAYL